MDDSLPAIGRISPAWADFFIMVGAFALVAIGALIWVLFFRKPGRRRRKHRHRHERLSPNPTLAQNGGLPPVRQEETPARRSPPTPEP
jgi:peptidoglycan/LPS O-acetylase OafA/YrhL